MILQKILFPNEKICPETELYFRNSGCEIFEELSDVQNEFDSDCLKNEKKDAEGVIFTGKGQGLSLDTYFNSFSVFKWKKYTNLQNLSVALKLIGDFKIEIKNVIRKANENPVKLLYSDRIHQDDIGTVCFDIPIDELVTGLVYIELTSVSDEKPGIFFGGEYTTDISAYDDFSSVPVKISIAMCTYKREKYVERNISLLASHLMNNSESPLHNNLEIYIADNSQSLDETLFTDKYVHIFPNKNLGGAGGFGRAMYEIFQDKKKKKFTHIIMMDDDVKFDPNVFERLYSFLSLIKAEYAEAHIGGAMLELDTMWLQSESGEQWFPLGHRPRKFRYDLRDIKWILKNEIEDSVDNFGWWFCCMPISVVRENNLPLPIFIKRDDIEYGVRNGRQFINLNGISVWHEAFDAKRTPFLDYYYYRNPLILNAGHVKRFGLVEALDYLDGLKSKIDTDVNLYRYREAHIKLQGVDDFLKGIDWLMAQDAEELNRTIMTRWMDNDERYIEDLGVVFIHGNWEKSLSYVETPEEQERRLETDNGWAVEPTKDTVFAPVKDPSEGLVCGARRVVYYDEITQKGYIAYRSHFQKDAVYKHYEMTRKNIIENFERVKAEYNKRFGELTDISFWNNYLFRDNKQTPRPIEWWEKIENIPEHRIHHAKECLKQYKLEISEQKKRIRDYPIVKNRVVFYLFNRRGFTCNIKYIMQELIKKAGDKLEIILVSDFPATCEKVRELGVPVIKGGTKEHWEYHFTARVNITSDCQPPYFYKRPDQIAINAWHGGISYKVIGYECLGASADEELEIYGMKNRQPDYWLSGSKRFTDDTAYGFRHDKKVFMPTGMARNDIFFASRTKLTKLEKEVKDKLGIPQKSKVALYAPTFRRGGKDAGQPFDIPEFKAALEKKWGGEWIVLYRGHYFIRNNPAMEALDVSQYDDMQELLCITDVLVSDYSSCMWDFSFTKRPIFVYATDFDNFSSDDRGFFLPPETWPFPIAATSEELCENVMSFDEKNFVKKIEQHHKDEGSFEKGSSAEAACRLIMDACGI